MKIGNLTLHGFSLFLEGEGEIPMELVRPQGEDILILGPAFDASATMPLPAPPIAAIFAPLPRTPRRLPQFPDDFFGRFVEEMMFDLDKEVASIIGRRPRPFRPTGNKRSRRRRKG